MKLRIFYLEERLAKINPTNADLLADENMELKVALEERIRDIENREELLNR